jgi:hypothetical protein
VSSRLAKLPDNGAGILRALVDELRVRVYDETPQAPTADPMTWAREAGYRAGHNDATRGLVRELESHLRHVCACSCGWQEERPVNSVLAWPSACPSCKSDGLTIAEVQR